MKNNNFDLIYDACQLVQGAMIKGKKADEIFELGSYDANKRAYTLFPFEKGIKYNDFCVLVSEKELMNHYLIEDLKAAGLTNILGEGPKAVAEINSI